MIIMSVSNVEHRLITDFNETISLNLLFLSIAMQDSLCFLSS